MGVTVKILPRYIELRHDSFQGWLLICRACSIRESYARFWPASYAAHAHADMHEAEEEGQGDAPTVDALAEDLRRSEKR
jgi:hypothetical protein